MQNPTLFLCEKIVKPLKEFTELFGPLGSDFRDLVLIKVQKYRFVGAPEAPKVFDITANFSVSSAFKLSPFGPVKTGGAFFLMIFR